MAIKNIIVKGVGFSPGSVKYLPTHGFLAGVAVATGGTRQMRYMAATSRRRRRKC